MSTKPETIQEAQLIVRDLRSSNEPSPSMPVAMSEEAVLLQVVSRAAADPRFDLDRVERLLVMQRELSRQRAEREFVGAMAEFKQNPPRIVKDKAVGFTNRDGSFTGYKHATLGAVCEAAIRGLGAVGISHRWDLDQQPDGRIAVTCVLTHKGGHSTRTMLSGSPDDSGKKNGIQQVASTISYLERYTLLAATGLATEDQDDDGAAAEKKRPTLSDEQLANLEALITEVGADRKRFMAFLKISSLSEIYSDKYSDVVKMLEEKRRSAAPAAT